MSEDSWVAVDEGLAELFLEPDGALDAASAASAQAGMPEIAVSPNLGKLLRLLVQISGSERVLEIGTLGGYSTIWLARGLPASGAIVSLELLDDHASVARENLDRAGLSEIAEIHVGPAADSLANLIASGTAPFDFIFLDADKESYPIYLERALALSRPGTLIVADNVVRKGAVFDASQSTPVLEGIRRFLRNASESSRLDAVGLQIVGAKGYDGVMIARVTG